jgi:hypothetical protein
VSDLDNRVRDLIVRSTETYLLFVWMLNYRRRFASTNCRRLQRESPRRSSQYTTPLAIHENLSRMKWGKMAPTLQGHDAANECEGDHHTVYRSQGVEHDREVCPKG